jgi:V/A-type H+-transporting ATPase subunit E
MITIEEKLKVFTRLVLGKAHQEYEQKLTGMTGKNKQVIEEHTASVAKRAQRIIEASIKKGQVQANRTVLKAKMERKRKILHKKQQLAHRLFENIKSRAVRFTGEQAYGDFFDECLSEVFSLLRGENSIMLVVTAEDAQRFKAVILKEAEKNGFSKEQLDISVSREDIIGGIVAVNSRRTLRVDCSVMTMLEDHRQLIGRELYHAVERAGDGHG